MVWQLPVIFRLNFFPRFPQFLCGKSREIRGGQAGREVGTGNRLRTDTRQSSTRTRPAGKRSRQRASTPLFGGEAGHVRPQGRPPCGAFWGTSIFQPGMPVRTPWGSFKRKPPVFLDGNPETLSWLDGFYVRSRCPGSSHSLLCKGHALVVSTNPTSCWHSEHESPVLRGSPTWPPGLRLLLSLLQPPARPAVP